MVIMVYGDVNNVDDGIVITRVATGKIAVHLLRSLLCMTVMTQIVARINRTQSLLNIVH